MKPRAPWASVKRRVAAVAVGGAIRCRDARHKNALYSIARRLGYVLTSTGQHLKRIQ
jgi:hypothetical protein